jgi:hypothetical protein
MSILDLLNPVKDLAALANDIIGKFVTDPKDKAALASQVAASQATLEQAALDASKSTILAEEQGGSWLQKSWRPIVSLGMFAVIMYAGVFVSLLHLPQINMTGVPPELWSTFKLCVGGYMGLRTLDKGVDAYFKSNGKSNGDNGNGK